MFGNYENDEKIMTFSCSANNSGILDDTPRYPVARANQNYGNQEYECAQEWQTRQSLDVTAIHLDLNKNISLYIYNNIKEATLGIWILERTIWLLLNQKTLFHAEPVVRKENSQ